jgi:protocatechuate 3,4-dioxygenase beta subunit
MSSRSIWIWLVAPLLAVGGFGYWRFSGDAVPYSEAAGATPHNKPSAGRTPRAQHCPPANLGLRAATPELSQVTLHGSVMGPKGEAVTNGVVCLRPSASDRAGDSLTCAKLTESGHFEIRAEASPGNAALSTSAIGFLDEVTRLSSRQLAGIDSITVTLQRARANLRGRVLDANGGTIAGATVRAQTGGVGKSRAEGTTEESVNSWLAATLTDELGRFQMSLPAGLVRLTAEASGYARTSAQVRIGEQSERNIELALTAASVIVGRLLDEKSRGPIIGVSVQAQRIGTVISSQGNATTDLEGRFRIQALTAGSYRLTLPSSTWAIPPTTVPVDAASEATAELLAQRAGSVAIRTKTSRSEKCASGFVTFDGTTLDPTPINEDGQAIVSGLLAGDYRVTVSCDDAEPTSQTVRVSAGERTEKVAEVPALTTVQGSVNYENKPVSGAFNVTLASDTGTSVSCSTSPEGAFSCRVAAGAYRCFAAANGKPVTDNVQIAVGASDIVGVELHLLEARGSVELTLQQAGGDPSLTSLFLRSAQSTFTHGINSGGTYRFDSVALGRHDVVLGSPNGPPVGSVRLEQANQIVKATIAIDSQHSVNGSVVDSRGQPVPDAWVALSPLSAPMNRTTPVLTDASGVFGFANLVAGTYRVFVESPWGTFTPMIVTETDHPLSVTLLRPAIADGVQRE